MSFGYDFKKKVGSDFVETWIYYRHSNRLINWLLSRFRSLLEPSEEDLR